MAAAPDLVLTGAVLAPVAGGLLSTGGRRSGRAAVAGSAAGLVLATVVAVVAGAGTTVAWGGAADPLVDVDRLAGLLLVFVLAVTLVVQAFAVRSLRGDVRRHRFFLASAAAASATALAVVAADLRVFVVAWVLVSVATVALLRHDGRPTARAAARRAAWTFAVGDAALVTAAVAATALAGPIVLRPVQLDSLTREAPTLGPFGLGTVLAVAAVAAALARSAQPPGQSWLPLSVAAPTPSSAVLHAGVVNGSGLLLIRVAPVVAASPVAVAIAVAGGCAGVLVGSSVMRARSDVKGALAWSTVAQMGFMTVQCVVGLVGPALVHLMAHGMYKANLFLGSGSTLAHTHPRRPAGPPSAGRSALVAAVALGTVGVAWVAVRPAALTGAIGLVFLGFVAAAVAQAAASWLGRRERRSRLDAVALLALVLATTASLAVADGIEVWLEPSLPAARHAGALVGAVALAATVAVSWLLAMAARHPGRSTGRLVTTAWLWARHLGDPGRISPVLTHQEVRA